MEPWVLKQKKDNRDTRLSFLNHCIQYLNLNKTNITKKKVHRNLIICNREKKV